MSKYGTQASQAAALQVVEQYEKLRGLCLVAVKDFRELAGVDAWLVTAIQETDLELRVGIDGVEVFGHTYSVQTQSQESFGFLVPWERIAQAERTLALRAEASAAWQDSDTAPVGMARVLALRAIVAD